MLGGVIYIARGKVDEPQYSSSLDRATREARGIGDPHRGVSVAARIRKLAKARLRVGAYAQSARFTRLVLLGHAVQEELVREQLRATGVARASLGICQHRYDRVVRPEPGSQRLIEK